MRKQKVKAKENKVTEFLILSIFAFCILIAFLNIISIQPSVTDFSFYLLLAFVIVCIYKPLRMIFYYTTGKILKCFFSPIKLLLSKNRFAELTEIDEMSGIEFERYLKHLYERHGYRVKLTNKSRDYGADLIIKNKNKKYVVQAKCFTKKVGIRAVQEVIGAIKHYKADGGIVVTNRFYTTPAKNLAKSNGIELIDRNELEKLNNLSNRQYKFASAISFILNKS
ncbi:restriction system protein [Ureibacillus xyleni]|uniref:Restriction system protein n=1 Tax=Ureibacillus xyleni TaxID=614648 RepID=A0A285RZ78_9BACL|nr:restriction endonuclease [Ureibacillus xyleni]SOB99545.1 restriction system protein [Ureibacillus xyleni]